MVSSNTRIDQLSKYWIDARDVLENLDEYQALWVKVHGCVWSECAIDQNYGDDDDNQRDEDEQWYLSRTQTFCANAAFSLYGIPRNHFSLFGGCLRGNFINSFFTYGSADTLLDAVGKYPSVYYDCDVDEQCDGGYYRSQYANGEYMSNADCLLGDDGSMSSTMGCDIGGTFAMAEFSGQSCRGSNFLEIVDPMHSYNKQIHHVGCHEVYGRSYETSSLDIEALLENSWSCDVNLYPHTCPDPYGKKADYNYALRAVAHGQNPTIAIANMKLKLPLRILGCLLFVGGIILRFFGYYIHNRERIRANGGGVRGAIRAFREDCDTYRKKLVAQMSTRRKKKEGQKSRRNLTDQNKKSRRTKSRERSKRERRQKSIGHIESYISWDRVQSFSSESGGTSSESSGDYTGMQ